jgi:thioredoxin reductase
MKLDYDVLIVGGGPSGLSAAMTLGRIRRSVLVADDNRPRNAPSSHINNFPTHDGIHPEEWRNLARKDLKKYDTVNSFDGRVLSVKQVDGGFQARLSSGPSISSKNVILAYGIKDKMQPIPGYRELWGKSIFHCPFCHGFETSGSKIGILINNEIGFHVIGMIQNFSNDIVAFTNGRVQLTDEQKVDLNRRKIRLVEDKIARLLYEGENLTNVELENGQKIERKYLFSGPELPFETVSDIGDSLGCKKTQFGLYEVNELGASSVPGVFAAGDNMTMAQSVLLSCAAGVKAGMGTLQNLLSENESYKGTTNE